MRRGFMLTAAGALALAALGLGACQKKAETGEGAPAAAPAGKASAPHRKAGLWSQTVAAEGMTQTTKLCVGPAGQGDDEADVTDWTGPEADGESEDNCSKNSMTPILGGWRFESVCDLGDEGQVTSTGELKGDLNANYVMRMKIVTTGASMPQANGTREMTMTGAYEGPCPAGMKPGDITLPGGMTISADGAVSQK